MPPYYCRRYVGAGIRTGKISGRDVTIFDTVEAGRELAIWMDEQTPQPVEAPDVQAQLDARGQRWMQCYSVICPEGEAGYVATPDANIIRVSRQEFERARASGWQLAPADWESA